MGSRNTFHGNSEQVAFGANSHLTINNHGPAAADDALADAVRHLVDAIEQLSPDHRAVVSFDGAELTADLEDPTRREAAADLLKRLRGGLVGVSSAADVITVVAAVDQVLRLI